MFTINLHNLCFHSFHGVHEEERVLGNDFVVNAELSFDTAEPVTALEQTVNYSSVYQIIKQCMNQPTALLETVAWKIANDIHTYDDRISKISVSIEKTNPPIPGLQGSVNVVYTKNY